MAYQGIGCGAKPGPDGITYRQWDGAQRSGKKLKGQTITGDKDKRRRDNGKTVGKLQHGGAQ